MLQRFSELDLMLLETVNTPRPPKSINFPWILFEYLLSVNGDDHALFLPLLDVGNLATRRFEQG